MTVKSVGMKTAARIVSNTFGIGYTQVNGLSFVERLGAFTGSVYVNGTVTLF
jgi:hypothetical protein